MYIALVAKYAYLLSTYLTIINDIIIVINPTTNPIVSIAFNVGKNKLTKRIDHINISTGNPYKNIEYFNTILLSTPIFT